MGILPFTTTYTRYSMSCPDAELLFQVRHPERHRPKITLLETIAIPFAVLFLKAVLLIAAEGALSWDDLIVLLSVGVLAVTIWLIRRSP